MASRDRHSYPRKALIALTVIVLALAGGLVAANIWSDARTTPRLGLDLEGGTQMVLSPRLVGAQTANADQVSQAVDIIRQRIDANGVSGAEVTTQGGSNIVVSIPGTPDNATLDAIRKSSEMQFRPVLAVAAGAPAPTPSPSGSASPRPRGSPAASPQPSGSSAVSPKATASPKATPSASPTAKSSVPEVLTASPSPTPSGAASPSGSARPSAAPSPAPSSSPSAGGATPTDPTSLEWVTPALNEQFQKLVCTEPGALDEIVDDKTKPLVTCDQDEQVKYILGPVVVGGDQIGDASAGYQTLPNGQTGTAVEISLTLKSSGAQQYFDISKKMVALPEPQNQLAATLDSRVIVAPRFNEAIPNGRASITGGFTLEEARGLAQQLKFGALPLSFDLQTQDRIDPTLGSEQLRYGLIAGLIGLLLVVVYSLLQYRALGFVTIASVLVAGVITYLTITFLGWAQNYRLDMAGVTGLIVAIGFTADSFIVYFERIRDELREGRSLASAVETGWARAKRTVVVADGVNLVAALVLYLLASANVRGFAFTLGLTTVIDLLITFLFTHPLVALLARRPFFRDGHPWSGLDPRRLRAKTTSYAGRGRFTTVTPRAATTDGGAR